MDTPQSTLDTPKWIFQQDRVFADAPNPSTLTLADGQTSPFEEKPGVLGINHTTATLTHHDSLTTQFLLDPPQYHASDGSLTRPRLGFEPQDLLHTAVSCTPCRPSDLVYDPQLLIFRLEKFHDVPDHILTILKPALALAERLLLQGNPQFWVDIACGAREVDIEKSSIAGSRIERLVPASPSPENLAHTVDRLDQLGRHLVIKFGDTGGAYGRCEGKSLMPFMPLNDNRYHAPGTILSSGKDLLYPAASPDVCEDTTLIQLDWALYAMAQKYSRLKYPDTAQHLRFLFFFAINLCHELAHGFERQCGNANYAEEIARDRKRATAMDTISSAYLPRLHEAMYKDWPNEIGAAFDYDTFGGRLHPINADIETRFGLQIHLGGGWGTHWDASMPALMGLEPYGKAIPMAYIEEIQQTAFWIETVKVCGVKVPRYGSEAWLINSTSTASFRQHLCEVDSLTQLEEDFLDQFVSFEEAESNEGPPSKRRRTSSGSVHEEARLASRNKAQPPSKRPFYHKSQNLQPTFEDPSTDQMAVDDSPSAHQTETEDDVHFHFDLEPVPSTSTYDPLDK
jgi:hypothetical protein